MASLLWPKSRMSEHGLVTHQNTPKSAPLPPHPPSTMPTRPLMAGRSQTLQRLHGVLQAIPLAALEQPDVLHILVRWPSSMRTRSARTMRQCAPAAAAAAAAAAASATTAAGSTCASRRAEGLLAMPGGRPSSPSASGQAPCGGAGPPGSPASALPGGGSLPADARPLSMDASEATHEADVPAVDGASLRVRLVLGVPAARHAAAGDPCACARAPACPAARPPACPEARPGGRGDARSAAGAPAGCGGVGRGSDAGAHPRPAPPAASARGRPAGPACAPAGAQARRCSSTPSTSGPGQAPCAGAGAGCGPECPPACAAPRSTAAASASSEPSERARWSGRPNAPPARSDPSRLRRPRRKAPPPRSEESLLPAGSLSVHESYTALPDGGPAGHGSAGSIPPCDARRAELRVKRFCHTCAGLRTLGTACLRQYQRSATRGRGLAALLLPARCQAAHLLGKRMRKGTKSRGRPGSGADLPPSLHWSSKAAGKQPEKLRPQRTPEPG